MEPITFTPTCKWDRSPFTGKKLSGKEYSLINNINSILEIILRNTLRFNKLTTAYEIYESLMAYHKECGTAMELDVDTETIENLCDAFCSEHGVLIRLKKDSVTYYKLNRKRYI